jgi:hypothetical protein
MHEWTESIASVLASSKYRMLMCGVEDPYFIAGQWAEAGFTAQQTEAWAEAMCFMPEAARALSEHGVTAAAAAHRIEICGVSMTLGYAVANGDLDPASAPALLAGDTEPIPRD